MSLIHKALAAFALAACAQAAAAFPDRPVRLIVPNTPGGPVDVTMRLLATELGKKWQQPIVIENQPGASGLIAGKALASAAPDGHTLGTVIASMVTIVPFTLDAMPFDPVADLAPVTLFARTPFVYVVRADSPFKTWQDFVEAAKERELTLGSYSVGTAFHLVWEETARKAGIKALYAPSSSGSTTQSDLVSGLLDIALEAPSSAKGLLDQGRLRGLAITSAERFAALPDVPTLDEAGMTGYSSTPWFGLMAPAGTPIEIRRQIQADVAEILQRPEMRERMTTLGQIPVASPPEELARTVEQDRAAMEPLVKELGIRLQ